MKSFTIWMICLMSMVLLVCAELKRLPAHNPVEYAYPVEIEKLSFSAVRSAEIMCMITAGFDLKSEIESTGEIEIFVDGQQTVNNRLLIRKGYFHYSVNFLLNNPEQSSDQHLYSATAKLSIKGISASVKNQAFVINNTILAGPSESQSIKP